MNSVFVAVAFASRDAGAEPTGMYSRRATATSTEFMSGAAVMDHEHLLCLTLNDLTDKFIGQQ